MNRVKDLRQLARKLQTPVAAEVSISGRIIAADGRGIRNALVVLTAPNGTTRTTRTGSFGYYSFGGVEVGNTYIISVTSKRFQFTPQIILLTEELMELNFIASE